MQVNLSEGLQRVPGLVIQNRQNYAQDLQVSIRGFGARSTFGVRGLRLYADGIPATSPDGQGQVSHFDLASAERTPGGADSRRPRGNRIPGIPRASALAELAWTHAPWGFEAALDGRTIARVAVDDANSDFTPGYAMLALRAGWRQLQGRWTVREFIRVDNVADRNFAGSVIVNEGNRRFFEPAPGRQWLAGVSAAYRF